MTDKENANEKAKAAISHLQTFIDGEDTEEQKDNLLAHLGWAGDAVVSAEAFYGGIEYVWKRR